MPRRQLLISDTIKAKLKVTGCQILLGEIRSSDVGTHDHCEGRRITSRISRHLSYAAEHLCHSLDRNSNRIPSIGHSRHALHCSWRESCHVDRGMRFLYRFAINKGFRNLVELPLKFNRIGGPNRLEHLDNSSAIAPRFFMFAPLASISSFDQPRPNPTRSRPLERKSI
jgi:hypothetical protein